MIEPGAIVRIGDDPKPWVVQAEEWGGSWKCVRPAGGGALRAFLARAAHIAVVSVPSHAVGDRVRFGMRAGQIETLSAGAATVRLDPVRRPLKGGGYLSEAGRVSVPIWQINVENKI